MNKVEDIRRRYNPQPAEDMPLNEWENPSHWKLVTSWGADEAFEQCLMDANGNIVGKVIKGLHYTSPSGISSFGLSHRVRRIKSVEEVRAKRQAAHEAKRAAAAAAKSTEEVTTLEFNAQWGLDSKTIERRTVYTNKSNRVIKTRSNGSPVVHEYKGKNYVIFAPNMNGRLANLRVWNDSLTAVLDRHG